MLSHDRFHMIPFFFLIVIAFFSSCSGKPPVVRSLSWQLNLVGKSGEKGTDIRERLSLFIQAEDEDGIKDLDALFVINDESGLFWKLGNETWIQREQNGETWIGTNGVGMADNSPLPRGKYRILLVDKAGDRDEKEFTLAAPAPIKTELPGLEITATELTVNSPWERTILYVLDRSETPFKTIPVNSGTFPLASVFSGDEASKAWSLLLAAWDSGNRVGLMVEKRIPQAPGATGSPNP
jgi:hypothetical protein